MFDRTKIELIDVNVYRQLYWGAKTHLLLLAFDRTVGGYKILRRLKKDWMCDEVLVEKNAGGGHINTGPREVTFTVGDIKGDVGPLIKRATVFELRGKRYKITLDNEPLDIRRIWLIKGKYNDQDKTPIVG